VASKWIYKIKHGVDGRIEKYKVRFVARSFPRKERTMMRSLHSLLDILPSNLSFILLLARDGHFTK